MTDALLVSNVLLWCLVIVLALVVLALARQVGVLHERVAPAGALMPTSGPKVGEQTQPAEFRNLAGELVTAWNWQRKVMDGEQQLAAELRRGYVSAMEQVVVSPCVQAQLDALSAGVLASGDTLTPFPVLDTPVSRTVVSIPVRSYLDGTWRALLDDGTLPHMASERRQLYDLAYERFERIEARNADAVTSRGRLLVLSQPIPLDPSVRLALLRELGEQSVRSRFQRLSAVQGMRAVDALGHTPDRAAIDAYLDASVTVNHCRAAGLPLTDVDVAMQDDGTRAPAP